MNDFIHTLHIFACNIFTFFHTISISQFYALHYGICTKYYGKLSRSVFYWYDLEWHMRIQLTDKYAIERRWQTMGFVGEFENASIDAASAHTISWWEISMKKIHDKMNSKQKLRLKISFDSFVLFMHSAHCAHIDAQSFCWPTSWLARINIVTALSSFTAPLFTAFEKQHSSQSFESFYFNWTESERLLSAEHTDGNWAKLRRNRAKNYQ